MTGIEVVCVRCRCVLEVVFGPVAHPFLCRSCLSRPVPQVVKESK